MKTVAEDDGPPWEEDDKEEPKKTDDLEQSDAELLAELADL